MKRNLVVRLFALMAAIILPAAPLSAQSTATIQGTVIDTQSAAVPGATVVVRNTGTGVERTLVTDAKGSYVAASLPPGMYQVEISLAGFQDADTRGHAASQPDAAARCAGQRRRGCRASECHRGSAGHRHHHRVGRHGRQSANGAGDSVERPALRRSRPADSRVGHAAAERVPDRAAARPGARSRSTRRATVKTPSTS